MIRSTFLNTQIPLFDADLSAAQMDSLTAVQRLYNRSLGPVTTLIVHRPEITHPAMYASACVHSPVGLLVTDLALKSGITDSIEIPGGGKGPRLHQCAVGGLAEAAERLLAVLHAVSLVGTLVEGTHAELVAQGHNALGPDELPLFAPEQYRTPGFPFVPFRRTTRLRWVRGSNVITGQEILVPAQLVLLHDRRQADEPPIGYPTSGGLSFHTDPNSALGHAVCELIERDAINVRWHCRLPPPLVDVDPAAVLSDILGGRELRLSTPTMEAATVFLNTLDVDMPVFTAITFDRHASDKTFLGAGGAAFDRTDALAQTLFELGQTRAAMTRHGESEPLNTPGKVGEMRNFLDATQYYGLPENRSRLLPYAGGRATIAWTDTPNLPFSASEPAPILGWLEARGLTPIAFDFGAGLAGIVVTKVVIPQLTQANQPAYPFLGHPRYAMVPTIMGVRDSPMSYSELNHDPVPFP